MQYRFAVTFGTLSTGQIMASGVTHLLFIHAEKKDGVKIKKKKLPEDRGKNKFVLAFCAINGYFGRKLSFSVNPLYAPNRAHVVMLAVLYIYDYYTGNIER